MSEKEVLEEKIKEKKSEKEDMRDYLSPGLSAPCPGAFCSSLLILSELR